MLMLQTWTSKGNHRIEKVPTENALGKRTYLYLTSGRNILDEENFNAIFFSLIQWLIFVGFVVKWTKINRCWLYYKCDLQTYSPTNRMTEWGKWPGKKSTHHRKLPLCFSHNYLCIRAVENIGTRNIYVFVL